MRILAFVFLTTCYTLHCSAQKSYQRNYDNTGVLQSEGWEENGEKLGYWLFYYPNGNIKKEGHYNKGVPVKYWHFYTESGLKKSEGHYTNGQKENWWLFYDDMEKINHKCQHKNNVKNGYCLMYKNEKLVAAKKFKNGVQINEWTDFSSFKKENDLNDLK